MLGCGGGKPGTVSGNDSPDAGGMSDTFTCESEELECEPLVFSYWDLDGESSLQTSLEVGATSYSSPDSISPVSGASVDFFEYGKIVPAPLDPDGNDYYIDNGDYLTLSGGGELVLHRSNTSDHLGALTNNHTSIALGFLPVDFDGLDADGDGTEDITEMYTNFFEWFRDQ